MSLHLVLQPGGTTVVLLPPQRIPECICEHTQIYTLSGQFNGVRLVAMFGSSNKHKDILSFPTHLPPPPPPAGWG